MASETFWNTFGRNKECSIRDCGQTSTKLIDLAVIGTRKHKSFNLGDWHPRVGSVELVVCDRCASLLDGQMLSPEIQGADLLQNPPMLRRPKGLLFKATELSDFLNDFVWGVIHWARDEKRRHARDQ